MVFCYYVGINVINFFQDTLKGFFYYIINLFFGGVLWNLGYWHFHHCSL